MCLTSCKEFRVRNFVYLTSLRSVYSLEEAFLHLLSYSANALSYIYFLYSLEEASSHDFFYFSNVTVLLVASRVMV